MVLLGDIGFPPEERFVVSRPGSSIRVAPGSLDSGLTAEWPSLRVAMKRANTSAHSSGVSAFDELSGTLFLAVGRHPLAGMAAAEYIDEWQWHSGAQYLADVPVRGFLSYGGRVGMDDCAETPSVQVTIHDFGPTTVVQEVRNLKTDRPKRGSTLIVGTEG